jgi:DNA-binding NtrC family response regulator
LEERKYRKLGTAKETFTDIRLISATNKNLDQESCQGGFRQDLLDRLNHRIIETIPLKDRHIDIIFLLNSTESKKLKIDPRVKYLLNFYDFPGNIRQLKTLLRNADDYQYIRNILVDELANRYGKNNDTILSNSFYAEMINDHE